MAYLTAQTHYVPATFVWRSSSAILCEWLGASTGWRRRRGGDSLVISVGRRDVPDRVLLATLVRYALL